MGFLEYFAVMGWPVRAKAFSGYVRNRGVRRSRQSVGGVAWRRTCCRRSWTGTSQWKKTRLRFQTAVSIESQL